MYLWKPIDFVLSKRNFFRSVHPVRVKSLNQGFYVICRPENIKALFESSWACTSIPFVKFALGYAFGLPAKALSLYDNDDSGGGSEPYPQRSVEARNRIDYQVHNSLSMPFDGNGLLPTWNRFTDNITEQLHNFHNRIGHDWDHYSNFMKAFGNGTTVSVINALRGPYLLKPNPDFLQDYWDSYKNLQTYLQGTTSNICFREKQKMFLDMDGFDYAAITSEDFGAIWAVQNSATTASWAIFDIYRNPKLLTSVRAEVDACANICEDGRIPFDIDDLLRQPVLQAVMPDKVDMNIGDCVIPRQKVTVTPTTVAHMDSEAWSTGSRNEHPIDQLWNGRLLKDPSKNTLSGTESHESSASPTFSTKELEGSWIPYGGEPRQCPGRHFAKRQILLTVALMVNLYDCEVLGEGKNLQEEFTLKGFGSGVSHPAGKVHGTIPHNYNPSTSTSHYVGERFDVLIECEGPRSQSFVVKNQQVLSGDAFIIPQLRPFLEKLIETRNAPPHDLWTRIRTAATLPLHKICTRWIGSQGPKTARKEPGMLRWPNDVLNG
ncbi:hypothetical protein G7054_g938 [Neopestalotiopsis clavispora]|nr:hypothetical protein G7054_g938 [Neopestalotiopsis clavispora]